MSARPLRPDGYELDDRISLESGEHFNFREEDGEWRRDLQPLPGLGIGLLKLSTGLFTVLSRASTASLRLVTSGKFSLRRGSRYRSIRRMPFLILNVALGVLLASIFLTATFWPSYTHLPAHYKALQERVQRTEAHGRGNLRNEKVFIAAVLYDPQGEIANGRWGHALLQLIQLLGEENVFLSIYENNSGETGQRALDALSNQVTCNHSILAEPDLSLGGIPRVAVPGGDKRIRRIDYLAEVRNRALRPLDQQPDVKYDKLLYLNDVIFDPVEALQLLFCTNAGGADGVAQYRAACAVDFSNAFKFYDTYATRDLEGYGIGLPFFPWFTTAGHAQSRRDVLQGRDAVRVRSCWGGMVAFDAQFFQGVNPVRFRADAELFWDASECCIVHADIQDPPSNPEDISDRGSYMNPFVRVAYDARSHSWLWTTRRFERLYPLAHTLLNHVVGLPWYNPRQSEIPGAKVVNTVWTDRDGDGDGQGGGFQTIERDARNDGFCGRRGLEVIVEDRKPWQDGFEPIAIPRVVL
ncbi:hypothetical protein P175DRAFT_0498762 [Aspergillus ochraceoroseus IBT 24754]|uniref:Glycosyltransferase family 69 protein n=1 Tax=Aspergillus ochraceoroseus IBT 24754 TaxID=1392256 RepID=A0A2T5MAY0_9EURO|nr:uncharacterized protein P175DRAFT_0498762 [Aspergillus ochraceoroseus IBT 24754]PTU25671.1 hypothetical protein P175DRAFT_0498762 [Aspergillus ochraceoroseus IBT 24754]